MIASCAYSNIGIRRAIGIYELYRVQDYLRRTLRAEITDPRGSLSSATSEADRNSIALSAKVKASGTEDIEFWLLTLCLDTLTVGFMLNVYCGTGIDAIVRCLAF